MTILPFAINISTTSAGYYSYYSPYCYYYYYYYYYFNTTTAAFLLLVYPFAPFIFMGCCLRQIYKVTEGKDIKYLYVVENPKKKEKDHPDRNELCLEGYVQGYKA